MAAYLKTIVVFLVGFMLGVILALLLFMTQHFRQSELLPPNDFVEHFTVTSYHALFKKMGYLTMPVNFDELTYSNNATLYTYLESNTLKKNVLVLCVMFVKKVKNAYAASNTWMKRCNDKLFFGLKPDDYLNITVMKPKSSWHYLCNVIRYIYTNYTLKYHWVLFVPDDIYAIPENLRLYVYDKNFNDVFYFGHTALFWNQYFNLAQAGYVISNGTIHALYNKFPTEQTCLDSGKYWKNEDYYLGKYLSEIGVTPTDTRDSEGRGRFHIFTPEQLMTPDDTGMLTKYAKKSVYPSKQGANCCSPTSITFQGTEGDRIYLYNYLLYSVRPFVGRGRLGNKISNKRVVDNSWQKYVIEELGTDVNLTAIDTETYYKLWADKIDSPGVFNERLRSQLMGKKKDKQNE